MKIVLYVEINSIEYLNKILINSNIIENDVLIPYAASFEKFEKSAKIILTYDQLQFLMDNNILFI